MRSFRSLVHHALVKRLPALVGVGVLLLGTAMSAQSAEADGVRMGRRATLAITYAPNSSTSVDLMGSTVKPGIIGTADVERKDGRTKVKVHMHQLPNPQSLGSLYTTYLLWAIAPEGQAANLAELPHSRDFDTEVTTSFQTFGLIVTAEPHSAVTLPSPLIVAENVARKDTVGGFQTGRLEYSGALYDALGSDDASHRDFTTPLLVLGAHRAVEIAKGAGAQEYDGKELDQAEINLRTLDRAWPRGHELPKDLAGTAREVMRTAEHARSVSVERAEQARLNGERSAATAQIASAMNQADVAKAAADRAQVEASAAKAQADEQRIVSAQAQASAEQARANEAVALDQADQARREADQAKGDREQMQQQLFQSLSSILETRKEARGLIVSLSDVLFDFDRSTLTPGAREKLSKLAGILIAYPGTYHVTTEGHTDAIGTHQYNATLSKDRAESVQAYLLSTGVPADRVGQAIGFAETQPVASNDNAAGRQMNRRVEIVIADLN